MEDDAGEEDVEAERVVRRRLLRLGDGRLVRGHPPPAVELEQHVEEVVRVVSTEGVSGGTAQEDEDCAQAGADCL